MESCDRVPLFAPRCLHLNYSGMIAWLTGRALVADVYFQWNLRSFLVAVSSGARRLHAFWGPRNYGMVRVVFLLLWTVTAHLKWAMSFDLRCFRPVVSQIRGHGVGA